MAKPSAPRASEYQSWSAPTVSTNPTMPGAWASMSSVCARRAGGRWLARAFAVTRSETTGTATPVTTATMVASRVPKNGSLSTSAK